MTEERIILGIDPGTNFMGYAIIHVLKEKLQVIVIGVLDMHRIVDKYEKMEKIYRRISSLLNEYNPTEFAIEAPFFGKNVQSMLKLGRVQGIAMAATFAHKIPITEYAPREIKQKITGQGEASKEKVAYYLAAIFPEQFEKPQTLDATDALAIAYAHYISSTSQKFFADNQKTRTKKSDWSSYVKANSAKVVS